MGLKQQQHAIATWQPVLWIVAKLVLIYLGARILLGADDRLGALAADVVAFFELEQIYNFELPTVATYTLWARRVLFVLTAVGAGYALVLQLQALFSTAVLDRDSHTFFYVEGYGLARRVHAIDVNRIEVVTLRQWLLPRLLRVGTLEVVVVSGQRLLIRTLWRAPQFVAALRASADQTRGCHHSES